MKTIKPYLIIFSLLSLSSIGFARERTVVTSFYPIYVACMNILEGTSGIRLINMAPPTAGCLHDYQLTPKDVVTLSSADVFVINGAQMEGFLRKVIYTQKNLKIIEASKNIPLLPSFEGQNSHVWTDPDNAIAQAENIAANFAKLYPRQKKIFKKNTEIYKEKILTLKKEMEFALKNCSVRSFVTFHDAFAYFAKKFQFEILGVIEKEPGNGPTPKELLSIMNKLKSAPSKVIFTEPQYSSKSVENIARETKASIYVLDPLVTGEYQKDAYLTGMKKNLEVLKQALNCK